MDQYEEEVDSSLTAALAAQLDSAPWYVSSIAIHSFVFLLFLLIPVQVPERRAKRIVISAEIVEEEEEEIIEEPDVDIIERDVEPVTDVKVVEPTPVVVSTDFEISDKVETEDDVDAREARGDPDNISTFDDLEGVPALMGIGSSGGHGGGGRFGNRGIGGRKNLLNKFGGDKRTESSVNLALKWLALHQEGDGHWDCAKYGGKKYDVGVSSLALLAFLGAGNSVRCGKYKATVHKAVYWLKGQQKANGCIGPHRYEAGIALMAAAEAFGMSGGNDLKQFAQRAVNWAVTSQCPTGGWDYSSRGGAAVEGGIHRVDTSVSGWWIMGLKSAKVGGLDVPYEVLEKALKYIQKITTSPVGDKGYGGYCRSSYAGNQKNIKLLTDLKAGGGSSRLTAVSLTCLQFLGRPRSDQQVLGCANQVLKEGFPESREFNFYRWYYAALGLFQMGGRSDYWRKWNEPMKKALLSSQVKEGTVRQNKGSWNYDSEVYGAHWGRVGQTALGALMLEIYYRYYDVHSKGHKIKF